MKKPFILFRSFRLKLTLVMIALMCFSALISDFIVSQYAMKMQLSRLQEKLKTIAHAIAMGIDPDTLLAIPLTKEGKETPQYKSIEAKILKIKEIDPTLVFVYILRKTEKDGIFRFAMDVHPNDAATQKSIAMPGDGYYGSRFPALMKGLENPSSDGNIVTDEWGAFLSGYAPIRDAKGNTIAVLGIDMSASDVHRLQREVRVRLLFVLLLGVIIAVLFGMIVSARVTSPIDKLADGVRHISSGDLTYRVNVRGADEISELAEAFNKMAGSLGRAREKLVSYFYHAVQSLVRILEARDPYTKGHSDRVTEYSLKIANEMGLPKDKIETLREAALLHDIGKLGIQEIILNKPGALNNDERAAINKHPVIGEEILKPISPGKELLSVVRAHHERYDGKGYPDGLSGDHISMLASIVAAADSFDAMTSHRAYQLNKTTKEAAEQLEKNKGTQFNPKVVDAFLRVLEKEEGI